MGELLLWKGRPSQWLNFGTFLVCILLSFLVIPLLYALWKYLIIRTWKFEFTTERIKVQKGVFSIEHDEIELFRCKDLRLKEPFLLRIVNRSTIVLITSDKTKPYFEIPAISNGKYLKEKFRMAVDQRRLEKGVKERDFD